MKTSCLITLVLLAVAASSFAADRCPDGVCALPGTAAHNGRYAVYSPMGKSQIPAIEQARRLDTLDGKTIALVGGSFMAYVTHPELKKLIQSHYKNTTVYVLNEIGSAGPWPGPGVVREQKDAFVAKLKEMKVDAVISGNGGCGLCTPKEMGSCIAAEYSGLPSVMIAAPGFTEQAKSAARAAGVPIPRVAEYPGAFSSHTPEELKKNTQEVLWPQIVKALTTPLSENEREKETTQGGQGGKDGIVFTGSMEEVQAYFAEKGWTDGLPIVPPTREAVAEYLEFTDAAADAVVATVAPARREVTVRQVAVNGVMAGCPPEYMPLLLAMTKAMSNGDFRRTLASTHAWTPYCWVNGPVARQLGLDHGQGEISDQRNARLGRFINLAMLNFGGYYIKENRMGTFGYLMPWCLAEDEAAALKLGWRPYHMQQGYTLNDNTLTAASALCWGNNLAPASSDAERIMEMMAWDATEKQQFAVGSGTPFVYRTMLVTADVARDLAQKYKSKEDLEKALVQTARVPLEQRATANYWGNPGSAFNPASYPLSQHIRKIAQSENAAETPTPPWLQWCGKGSMQTVPVMQEGKTAILITGDSNRNKTMCLPGGGFATVAVELPQNWDKLMEKKGYAPLASFELKSELLPVTTHPNAGRYRRQTDPPGGQGRAGQNTNSRPQGGSRAQKRPSRPENGAKEAPRRHRGFAPAGRSARERLWWED